MPRITSFTTKKKSSGPDYIGLVNFLVKPFLEYPNSLSVDCEQLNQSQRVWIRIAFEDTDKGRVYGRGGRNIQAVRNVLQTTAALSEQVIYLDIYGESEDPHTRGFYLSRERDFQDRRDFKSVLKKRENPAYLDSSKYSKPSLRFRRSRSRSRFNLDG
jgi:hypothetical protein